MPPMRTNICFDAATEGEVGGDHGSAPPTSPGGPSCRSSSTYTPERNTKGSSRTRSHQRVAGWLGTPPGARMWLIPPEAPYLLGYGRDGLDLVEHDIGSR